MTNLLFGLGAVTAVSLVGVLLLTIAVPALRIWPTAGDRTWQSYVFWPLFRGLNVLCFVAAIVPTGGGVGLPAPVRILALLLLAASLAIFIYAFRVLGRDNSYCAADGLVTGGIYRWSRNPQNAMLIAVYACLAVAADNTLAYLLCGAMMTAYALMVLAEEPWLASVYGKAYDEYCRQVPRFFAWRRAFRLGRLYLRGGLRGPVSRGGASSSRLSAVFIPLFALADGELLLAAAARL